ncbi:hypothetical protein MPTK1_5g07190 [Marchantia polymorpha subsp. ruderalis]|uniref:Uncharacterized protein n=2 Tax=Marchantia polymorpha TaxID=3197 RepID=A0AAF6BFU3_MARPO|nr:hypothetical protein MARPO_0136s0002 [Marchantia polymorpha]BBN10877.1 hypothetical protein Mp_5g07190 [Marchantia polymorpha subsp. ruderalis]|eukprot:PTQ29673.1 hypothetical protein MARPO_0136s0002 [Marchantia polymorpha]
MATTCTSYVDTSPYPVMANEHPVPSFCFSWQVADATRSLLLITLSKSRFPSRRLFLHIVPSVLVSFREYMSSLRAIRHSYRGF